MSTYNERYDEALSKSHWVSKSTSKGKTLLLKYAPHPERTGYIFAATDLETVYFEVMTAPSIPTRLAQIAEREDGSGAADEINSLGFDEQQERTETTLKQLSGAFDGEWESSSVEQEVDDYFDAVFVLHSPSVTWLFTMTELRGRQPLSFISKHLLSPLTLLLAQDRGVDAPPSGRPVSETVGAIISDPGVARALRRLTGAPPPASSRATPVPHVKVSRAPSPPKASPSPTPKAKPVTRRARTPPQTKSPVAAPATPERGGASQTIPPLINPSSPTPHARKMYDYAAGILPSSDPSSPQKTSDSILEDKKPAKSSKKQILVPETEESPPPPSTPPRQPSEDGEEAPTSSAAEPPSSTMDPLVPTQQKKKKKKRDKKEEETLEEAEAEKRRADMKRRMAAGGGGGRLGRRRL